MSTAPALRQERQRTGRIFGQAPWAPIGNGQSVGFFRPVSMTRPNRRVDLSTFVQRHHSALVDVPKNIVAC